MTLIANRPSQKLVDLVGALGGTWHRNVATCRCPAHTDKTPSLSLRQGDRGILVTCFAGCDPADILRELDRIPLGQRYEPPKVTRAGGTANIERLWNEARGVPGTCAERYLASRFPATAADRHSLSPALPHSGRSRSPCSSQHCSSPFAKLTAWSLSKGFSSIPQRAPTPRSRRSGPSTMARGVAVVWPRR